MAEIAGSAATTISASNSQIAKCDGCCTVSTAMTAGLSGEGNLPVGKQLHGSAEADSRRHPHSCRQKKAKIPHIYQFLKPKRGSLPHPAVHADGTSAPAQPKVQCAGSTSCAADPVWPQHCRLQQDQTPSHCLSGNSFSSVLCTAGPTADAGTPATNRPGSARGSAQAARRRHQSNDKLPDSSSVGYAAGLYEQNSFDCAGPAAEQTCIARTKLLQELAQQRELLQFEALRKSKLRCRLNSSFDSISRLKGSFSQTMSAQDDRDAGLGDHGQAAAVSTAVEQRLQALQELIVPTAIEHQQQARRVLQDRDMGLLHTLRFKWQDYILARRLRRIAGKSRTAATGASVTAADRKPDPVDPLVQGVRPVMRDAKLPEWLLGFRPGFNPDAGEAAWDRVGPWPAHVLQDSRCPTRAG